MEYAPLLLHRCRVRVTAKEAALRADAGVARVTVVMVILGYAE